MKNYIITAAIASLAVAAIGGGFFDYLNQTKAAFMVRYDITDDRPQAIDTSEVPQHIASVSSEWSQTQVMFSTFSNFRENKITTVTIPAQFPLLANPNQRSKLLKTAYQKITDTLNNIVAGNTGRSQSVLYEPMANDLNKLAKLNAKIKEGIFYTDCQENINTFSMYRDADVAEVIYHSNRVKAFFEKQVPLDSLKGITVYIIYNSPTPFLESRFLLMANLWAEIFRAHGATVIIGPNLTTN